MRRLPLNVGSASIILSLLAALVTVGLKGQYCLPIFSGAGADTLLGLDPFLIREGRPDLFKYGPIWALMLAPLASLPAVVAPYFWALLNAACFWAAVFAFKQARPLSWLEASLLFPLVLANGFYGQINGLLLWLIVLMLSGIRAQNPWISTVGGIAGALAIWMKLFPAALVIFALKRPMSTRFLSALILGMTLGVVAPIVHWGPWIFESWLKILQHDVASPHHKIGLLALLVGFQIPESAASHLNQIFAGISMTLLAWVSLQAITRRSQDQLEGLWLTCFLIFSHMTKPPTLALLAPAVIVTARQQFMRVLPLLLLLLVLPSDLTPSLIKAPLGGNYGIKTMALLYVAFLLAFTRDPGRTRSPG